jgi:tetratricopeptide (TPR) repeat protein
LLAEYDRELAAIGDVPAAASLHYESGRIWEEKLAQPRNAWQCYNRAFQLQPRLVPNIRAARRLASQVGNWNVSVQIIDSEIEAIGDPRVKAHLLQSKGLVLEEKLGQIDQARKAYNAALEAMPTDVEILRQIERLAISSGDWKTVLDMRAKLLELVEDPRNIVQLLLSCARIHHVHFNDAKRAEDLYEQVLKHDPDNRIAIQAMRQIYADTRRHEKLLDLLFKEATLTADPAAATNLLYQAARIQREQLNDEEQALAALQRALGLSPNDHMILGEMAQLYENLMRWQELVEVYERQVQVITDRQELVSLYFKLGNIWEEKLFNEDRAIPHYRKVVELNPNYLPALQSLGKLFYRKGQWDELVQMYIVEIRETKEPKQRAIKLYKLAEILEERLSRDEEAIQKFEQCLELNPGYLPALKALGRLYSKYNRWESLIQMYENELAVTPDHDQAVFLLDKIGTLWEEKLNNVDKSISTYQRILERSPNYLPAIRTLGKLFVRADRWVDLIKINELESQLINDQKQVISLLHRNGEIYEEKLNDKDMAIETYKEVLALSPAYLPALQSLGRLYFIKGMWEDLIAMYRQEIEVTQNESQQITLLYKIGELFEEKLVQEDNAIASYREVLTIQPGNFPALKSLIRIYTNKRDWQNLIEVLEQEAATLEDSNQRAMSLFRVAEIWEVQQDQPQHAIETLQRVLHIDPKHGPTIRALVRLYTQSENWRELLDLHERETQNHPSEARQVENLFRAAEIYATKLNDLVRAAETFERILGIQADHMPSLEALERIYLAQRNYPALVRVYEALAARTSDPKMQISLHRQLADLKENRLQPPKNAAEHYLRILQIDPGHPEASRALDGLYHKFGTWHGLRMLYERELRRTTSSDEAQDLCMRIADLAENRLQQIEVAIHYYQEALRLNPELLPAIKALKRIYRARDDADGMIGLLDREGRVTRDPTQAISTLLQAGALYRDRFEDPGRAVECFFKVLERDPKEVQAFAQLESSLNQLQDWERLTMLYRNRVAVTEDSRHLADLHLKMGVLLHQRLLRSEDAAESYRAVLLINPSHLQALSALASISFQTEQWEEVIQLSNRILELAGDPETQAEAHFRLGVTLQEKKPDLDRAVSHLARVAELQPGNVDALQRLRVIHSARQNWPEAIETLRKLVEADPTNRIAHWLELAGIYDKGLNDPDKAVEAFGTVQQLDPSNASVIQKMGELYERLERWPELIETYQTFISMLPPDRVREGLPLHMRIGTLYAKQLSNTDKAIIEYKKAAEIDPNNHEVRLALADLYGKTGLYYANAVDEHRKLLTINPFRIESYHELRRIFEEQRAFDKVFCVCAVLHYLRAADQNEEFFYGENSSKAPEKTSERLTPEEIERLLTHPVERNVVRLILRIIGPHLSKVFPADLARHGVGKADRARSDDPLRTLADSITACLGEAEYDLFRSAQPNHLVAIENTSPHSLVVGEGLVKRTQVKEQRFALARALRRVMDGTFLATQLGAQGLAQLIAAAVLPYHPSCPVATFPSQMPDDLAKKVQKALPRKSRKALEELLKQQAPELARVPDYTAMIQAMEHSANRTGLALCTDLANAIMHLSREIPELSNKRLNSTDEIAAAISKHPTLCELIRFSVSEEYFILRARLKLSIVG